MQYAKNKFKDFKKNYYSESIVKYKSMHSDSCYTVFATTLRVSLNLLHRKKKKNILRV